MTCILCLRSDVSFNKEHVFPDMIGGVIKIKEVCVSCNSILNKRVDTPFSLLPGILHHRQMLTLKRERRRDIRSPFGKTRYPDKNGNHFFVTKSDDWYKATYPLQTQVVHHDQGTVIKTVISTEFIPDGDVEAFARQQKERVEKEYGVQIEHFDIATNQGELLFVEQFESHHTILLACLKVGYELAAVSIDNYVSDELARIYATVLLNGKIDEAMRPSICPDGALKRTVIDGLSKFNSIWGFDCFCMLQNIKGFGLVATVRMFHIFHSFLLSKRTDYIDDRQILFLNDCSNRRYSCTMYKKPDSFSFIFDSAQLTDRLQEEIESTVPSFQCDEGVISLYQSNGEVLVRNIELLWQFTLANRDCSKLGKMDKVIFKLDGSHYLKSKETGNLFAISEVVFLYNQNRA